MIQPNISAEKIHQCEFLSKKATQKHTRPWFVGVEPQALKPWSHRDFLQEYHKFQPLVMVSSCHNWSNLLSPFQNGVLIFSIWGFPKIVVPQNGWFIRETLLKWMIWGYHHLRNTHMFPGIHVRFGLLIFSPVFLWDLWDFPGRKIPAFLGSN